MWASLYCCGNKSLQCTLEGAGTPALNLHPANIKHGHVKKVEGGHFV